MDINGGDKNRVFLHDLIKITEGTVSEGTIFMHILSITRIIFSHSRTKQVWKQNNNTYINNYQIQNLKSKYL